MDWISLLENNSQSFFTLAGVLLGSLITFIISYLNNRFEAKEREKDRLEQRRESGIRAREKWIERDILKIMDSIESVLKLQANKMELKTAVESFGKEKITGLWTQEELDRRFKSLHDKVDSLRLDIFQSMDILSRLVNSFEELEIHSSFNEFLIEITKSVESPNDDSNQDDSDSHWIATNMKAGKLHKVLRDKMTSLHG